ncbi:MAG: energy transducer TonB [Bacteroidota bacterium]|nr:energy transducer TonB [Bacteroidota bacterium]
MITKNNSSRHVIIPVFVGFMIVAGLLVSFHMQAGNLKMASVLKNLPHAAIQLGNGNLQTNGSSINYSLNTDASEVGSIPAMMTSGVVSNKKQLLSNADNVSDKMKNALEMATLNVLDDSNDTISNEKVYEKVDQMPEFPGGVNELIKFLQKNLKYPLLAQENHIEGTVVLSFIVSKTGEISNIRIKNPVGGGCGKEAVRIVKLMPKWKPGVLNGVAVPVKFVFPLKFVLH